mmetsp:Transcript_218/g.337  ORF Transcript_218/g.337 Transcript_218/m.337 type:complete len:894 (+) Transcript_218:112-2793(+)
MCPREKIVSVIIGDDDNLLSRATKNDQEEECRKRYGPYPQVIPSPYLSNKEDTLPKEVLDCAATMFDLPEVDYRDKGTPDEWLPRDGRLIRLTGRHPFNVEPPLAILDKYKFITPTNLQYVRNHGACPRLSWDEHTVCIGGPLVSTPLELSMNQIASFPPRVLPVTLVCAGNRRKEQNSVKQTIGFNWGSSGVSTSVWKGVLLRDLLIRAGVDSTPNTMRGKFVEFIGVEDLPNKVGPGPFPDEPWGKLVKYGTSVPLARAMNPAYDIIIAYEANGEKLQPDHGYPVRLIVPGYIGGRMIKWLKHINVLTEETKNHYHYHDNRILPPNITAEESLNGWWYKPEYIFNELNINSAVARPDHNECINFQELKEYKMGGYAYTGGGRMITRVEVSLDGGHLWQLATIDRKEEPTEHGMYWCWIWWNFTVSAVDFLGSSSKEIWCRAWDESNNCQPNNPTWNLMGMGNNHTYRVKFHAEPNSAGGFCLRFEHPTQAGQLPGGWMTVPSGKPISAGFGKLADYGGEMSAAAPVPAVPATKDVMKKYTLQEVEKHNTEHDCWIIVKNRVYDCTQYLELHPGGVDSIMINAGMDATEDFVAIHSTKATKMLEKYYIGDLDTGSTEIEKDVSVNADVNSAKVALDPKKKIAFKLREKIILSHDSFILDFALQTKDTVLGLPTGKHVFLSAVINNETVMRRYTPISSDFDVGCIKFVIKAYYPNERFPKGGKMSQHLDSLKIGDTIDIRGPVGEFHYLSIGKFTIDAQLHFAAKFNMIAGGTGITPVMQIASEILRNSDDKTKVRLIFGCQTEKDILLRDVLDEWATLFPSRFSVHYILSESWPKDWKFSTGFVNKTLFEKELFASASDVYNLMCGPPVMLERGCIPNLGSLGHSKKSMFCF